MRTIFSLTSHKTQKAKIKRTWNNIKAHLYGSTLSHAMCLRFSLRRELHRVNRGVPSGFFGIRDFPSLKLGIRNFKAKSGPRDAGLKVCAGDEIRKITLGILGRYLGIEEPYWRPSKSILQLAGQV